MRSLYGHAGVMLASPSSLRTLLPHFLNMSLPAADDEDQGAAAATEAPFNQLAEDYRALKASKPRAQLVRQGPLDGTAFMCRQSFVKVSMYKVWTLTAESAV